MRSGQDVLPDLDTTIDRGWLVADGLGGSASGPLSGPPRRRTQALLTTAAPHGRLTTLLLRFEERVTTATTSVELAHQAAESFAARSGPAWRFRLGETVIERRMLGIRGHAALIASWSLVSGPETRIAVSPLLVARDPGALQPATPELSGGAQGIPGRVQILTRAGQPDLTIWHGGSFIPARVTRRVEYALEGAAEMALIPGHFEARLSADTPLHLVVSPEAGLLRALAAEERLGVPPPRTLAGCVAALEADAGERDRRWLSAALAGADFTARQAAAAHGGEQAVAARRREPLIGPDDAFAAALARQLSTGLTRRGPRLTLVESLPLGRERGAAALRAVHGLVSLRAFDPAREILRAYADCLDEGVAPERFDPEDGRPLYGDPAPGLWLISAAEFLVRRSGDTAFLDAVLGPLESILQAYRSGTRHGIRVDGDGLLVAGEGAAAARRAGPNALWYHALIAMAQLARQAGRRESSAFYLAWARDHQTRFNERLWDEAAGTVRDLDAAPEAAARSGGDAGRGATADAVLAASLLPAVLSPERALCLLRGIERERFTPFGLREGAGSPMVTTEWLGPFLLGWVRAHQRSDAALARVRGWLAPFAAWLANGAAGIPARVEIEDGAGVPLHPVGDPLSVVAAADLLRVWVEELEHPAPLA